MMPGEEVVYVEVEARDGCPRHTRSDRHDSPDVVLSEVLVGGTALEPLRKSRSFRAAQLSAFVKF
jgi:hypothetical protein